MEPEGIRQTREWLEKSLHDRISAEVLLTSPELSLTDTASFHCQQAVEKALKAFLTYHGQIFEKVHAIARLCRHCATIDPGFEQISEPAATLSRFAVQFRYPGDPNPSIEEVHDALKVVKEVTAFVLERLPQELQEERFSS